MKPTEPVSIDGITFDAMIDLDENWDADVPSFPVETGFEVSDTIVLRPIKLSMKVFLTNTPVTWKQLRGTDIYRVDEVIERLKELYFSKTPITVSTSDNDYEDMAIVNIALPKTVAMGSSKEIPITFQQIRTVEAATTSVPASLGRGGASGVNSGTANVNARPASTPASGAVKRKVRVIEAVFYIICRVAPGFWAAATEL